MNANQEVEKTLAHQASQWVTVLRGEATRGQLAAFSEWIKTSPRHVRDFLIMSAIEKELHAADPNRQYGMHELGDEVSSAVVVLNRRAVIQRPLWKVLSLAASIVGVLVVASLVFPRSPSYSTQVGEQRTLELEDGSIVHLNTRSRIAVHMSEHARDIELVAGEALFKVHHDKGRPFRVHSGNARIEALGTEFNVYKRDTVTLVSVLEGAVRASGVNVKAGEAVRISGAGGVLAHERSDLKKAVAWQQRRLVFDQDSLTDIVREFNRYNKSPQFELMGNGLANRHYTGVFDADDPESLRQLLASEPDLVVRKAGDKVEVRVR